MKHRMSKFELIRILAMYLIVLHHSFVHGVLDFKSSTIQTTIINHYPLSTSISYILASGGKVGVYLFILITGYFMINSTITLKKIIRLWLPILFWSVFLALLIGEVFSNNISYTIKSLITVCLPITFNQYWFVTVYVFMYLLIPFLNICTDWIDKTRIRLKYYLLISILLILSNYKVLFGGPAQIGSMLLIFCIVYTLGALIRKENILKNLKYKKYALITFIILFILEIIYVFTSIYMFNLFSISIILKLLNGVLFSPWTFLTIIQAICIFILIGSSNITYHPIINQISSVTFGIYLISDNKFLRPIIWNNIFHLRKMIVLNPFMIIILTILISLIVFILSGLLEKIRQFLFSNLEDKISNYLKNIFSTVLNK